MHHLIDVWFKPWVEVSAVDEAIMAIEVVALLLAIAFIKVFVVDRLRGIKYYKEER